MGLIIFCHINHNHSHPVDNVTDFTPLTDEDVYNLISRSSGKSCDIDPIPASLLKSTPCTIVLLIGSIINKSLSTGTFPMTWKKAVVKPLLKEPGLECIFKNYRPVLNLPSISKLIKRQQLNKYKTIVIEIIPHQHIKVHIR